MTDKEFKGKVDNLNLDKKILFMHDEGAVTHPFKVPDELDTQVKKLVQYKYLALKYDDDTLVLKDVQFWKNYKDEWKPQSQNARGGVVPRKPRVTIGFTIAIAQYENVRVDIEGKDVGEVKALLAETLDALAPNHEPTKDLIQRFKQRLL